MSGSHPLAATVEDYDSDDSEVVTIGRRQVNVPGQANVAAKRSHPSDLGNEKPVEVVGPDAASDSGYSSHTAATMSSADSAQSQKSGSPPVNNADAAPAPSLSRRRPTLVDTRKSSSQNSPRKPLGRTGSSARRAREGREEAECTVQNCECKQSQQSRSRRPQPSPLDSALDISYPPFDQRSQRSDPSSQNPPQSPISARRPTPYSQNSTIIQPATTTTRRRSLSTSKTRPISYHAGVTPDAGYWVPGMPYPTPAERGPPSSMSAHYMQPMQPFPMMGATPPNNYYPQGHPLQTSPPYDAPRPALQPRTSSQYSTRRPTYNYGPPVISYEPQPFQSSSNISTRDRPSARYDSKNTSPSAFDTSSSEDEFDSEEDADRALMPPPKPKAAPQRRPSLRSSNTPNSYNNRLTQSQTLPERDRDRDARSSRPGTTNPSRSSSVRRPSLSSSGRAKATSYSNSSGSAKVTVETASSRRRQSYMGHERTYELEEKHRDADQFHEEPRYRGETQSYGGQQRRRQTDLDGRRRDENIVEDKKRDAELYQQRIRGDAVPALTEQALKAAKRSSRVPSGESDAGSTRSKNSSHDKASRISVSNRTNITNTANGEIKMRIDPSTSINLEFTGDMEGRTIRLAPADDGMAELIIGSSRGTEAIYKSERGSVSGRRTIAPRREAEEASVRSRRSSRSGRDTERRPLRRRQIEE
ncbi:hypothetical protein K432DRAFT_18831 [Lepidopterella palustris CBS 459.81]|uniref:Uncharacterized protein n=1 Tax=Lepidopterella palustris CBS 459.81 TaxID=1314670 RepID=A0A8E2EKR0_9PEZI|nr:hypothetical protein K432DRAFT_18831 [Lepidopterella palustris CBS 459.81]